MLRLEWIWERRNRTPVLLTSSAIALAITAADWWAKRYFYLGLFYVFPIILAAGFLGRWAVVLLGIGCALLSQHFDNLDPSHAHVRLGVEALALCSCGLLAAEALRRPRLNPEVQERIDLLVQTSPAAIIAVDERGAIELANRAAIELLASRNEDLIGLPIAGFLPELHHALRWEEGPQFRTSMQCPGYRDNGEPFLAEVWFSGFREGTVSKLAAIIADVSEERTLSSGFGSAGMVKQERALLDSRELEILRLVVQGLGNRQIATQLGISENEFNNTFQQLLAKTAVDARAQLVRVALGCYRDIL